MKNPVYIVVTPFFPSPNDWRGSYCYDFVVALNKAGRFRVEVFVPGMGDDYEIDGVEVHRFSTYQLPSSIFPFLCTKKNQKSFLRAVERAGITIHDVAVCHGHTAELSIYPLAVKKLNSNCLTLLHHHDLQSFGLNGGILKHCWLHNIIQFPLLRWRHEQIDCHIFCSEASRSSFLAAPDTKWTDYADYKRQMRWLPYRPAKIRKSVILHNGVDTSIFYRGERLAHDGFVVGCVGNFDNLKDQIMLLRAIAFIKNEVNIKVVFVGTGEKLDECKDFARDMNLDVEFRLEMPHKKLSEFYRSIDLFVLPSYFEGFGCVFTEAWACGTPFITCEGQGINDLIPVEDRDKWLCKAHDFEDLGRKILCYIKRPPMQRLTGKIDIAGLTSDFLSQLDKI